jgi:hypothetical protein
VADSRDKKRIVVVGLDKVIFPKMQFNTETPKHRGNIKNKIEWLRPVENRLRIHPKCGEKKRDASQLAGVGAPPAPTPPGMRVCTW